MANKPRAVTSSAKAKQAAAVAASEAQEAEAAAQVVPKKRGRPKKVTTPVVQEPEPEDNQLDEDAVDDEELAIESIEWSHDLVWTLVTAIEDNEEIRDSLFPGVGSIRLSGGKPKTHHYYNLAVKCFAEHPTYQDVFAGNPDDNVAKQQERRKTWTDKIKNKIKKLVKKARDNIDELGQTGAGIGSEEEILPGTSFTTKWEAMKADSPWFFNVRALIAARPNLQPVGLGNGDSGYDLTLLLPVHDGDETSSAPDDTQDFPDTTLSASPAPGDPSDAVDISSDSDDDPPPPPTLSEFKSSEAKSSKRKRADDDEKSKKSTSIAPKPPNKKTKPQPAASLPATAAAPIPKKAINSKDRFSATVLAEEETQQRMIALKKDKNDARRDIALAKIRVQGEIQVARAEGRRKERAAKLDLMRLKLEQEHQRQMAQIQAQAGSSSMSLAGSSSSHQSGVFSSFLDDSELPRLPSDRSRSVDTDIYNGFGQYSGPF